jgi:hypothetical protein
MPVFFKQGGKGVGNEEKAAKGGLGRGIGAKLHQERGAVSLSCCLKTIKRISKKENGAETVQKVQFLGIKQPKTGRMGLTRGLE